MTSSARAAARSLAVVVLAMATTSLWNGPAGAQDDPTGDTVPTVPGTSAPASTGITTTTLPEDDSDLGRIIPLPDSGREPESAGDRGGWQQVTLFFAICAVIVGIGLYVWWRSRRNRDRLRAEGLDRVDRARRHGGDVRRSDEHPAG